ncbi:hypothetical protein EWM64_g7859 [Hericium alpestre]|uniref:Ubiquitin-like protease family profile domain-containing protein n=1 Tax=Hericium alpestre TaxID=135208 RepID=A0A4Y9ZQ51_9AGAM|nr:hypothetical protein EWM64_g7859 [Hericium alpestre]
MRLDRFRRLVLRRLAPNIPPITNKFSPAQGASVTATPSGLRPVSNRASLHCCSRIGRYPVLVGGASEGTSALPHDAVPELVEISDSDPDSEDEDFVPSEWISRGIRWSDAIPSCVRRARNAAHNVPPAVLEHVIPPSSQVVAVVLTQLPSPIALSPGAGQPSYLSDPPNILNDNSDTPEFSAFIENLCLPALIASANHAFTSHLRSEFDNAWLSGARSLHFPAAPHYRWPLWVQRLLEMLHVALEKQQKWKCADSWLQTIEQLSSVDAEVDLVAACRERLEEIPWDAPVPGFGDAVCLRTTHLATFLSDDWLNDEMINAGAAHILHELGSESRVRLANCFFLDSLRNIRARSPDQPYLFNSASSLDCDIRAGHVHVLEVPVNPGGHWTGVKVDLRMKSFAYRDGANPKATVTSELSELLTWYLATVMGVDGGGAPSRQKIAIALFKRAPEASTWSSLTASEKNKVNALNVPLPAEVNEKFVPRKYRSNELGDLYLKHKGVRELIETDDGQTPWLRFAKGAVSGQFKSQETALAMIEAMVIKVERLQKGKSLRNMRYAEGLDTFSNYLASISPRAYRAFQRTFAGRSLRNIQQLRAKQPRFEPGISTSNIKRAVDNIQELGYEGPLVFSWDDTDLEKALTVFQAPEDQWLILGAIQGVISVSNVEGIDEALGEARLDMADKASTYFSTFI